MLQGAPAAQTASSKGKPRSSLSWHWHCSPHPLWPWACGCASLTTTGILLLRWHIVPSLHHSSHHSSRPEWLLEEQWSQQTPCMFCKKCLFARAFASLIPAQDVVPSKDCLSHVPRSQFRLADCDASHEYVSKACFCNPDGGTEQAHA